MSTTTKKELVDRIARNTQAKHVLVKATVQDFLDEIVSELARGNRLTVWNFVTLAFLNLVIAHQGQHRIQRPSNESTSQPNEQSSSNQVG
jgi:hypothetical protein